jgi:RHO1 GDP-GTP exchange protein 1/2
LTTFSDPPTQRGGGLIPFRGKTGVTSGVGNGYNESPTPVGTGGGSPEASDSRWIYPYNIHHNGRLGGLYTLYAESSQLRSEWKAKLEEAIGLRKVVQESNKVFEVETLSADTFLIPSLLANPSNPSWNNDNSFTGKVSCSVPFSKSMSLL